MFQYFVKVVPTVYRKVDGEVSTFFLCYLDKWKPSLSPHILDADSICGFRCVSRCIPGAVLYIQYLELPSAEFGKEAWIVSFSAWIVICVR